MSKHKTREELQELIDTHTNGNLSIFRETLQELTPYDLTRLISMWQPYHSALTTIRRAYEEVIGTDGVD